MIHKIFSKIISRSRTLVMLLLVSTSAFSRVIERERESARRPSIDSSERGSPNRNAITNYIHDLYNEKRVINGVLNSE